MAWITSFFTTSTNLVMRQIDAMRTVLIYTLVDLNTIYFHFQFHFTVRCWKWRKPINWNLPLFVNASFNTDFKWIGPGTKSSNLGVFEKNAILWKKPKIRYKTPTIKHKTPIIETMLVFCLIRSPKLCKWFF